MQQPKRHSSAHFYAHRQPIRQESFTHARVAHVQRIVLFFSAKHMNSPFLFCFPADERVMVLQVVVKASYTVAKRLIIQLVILLSCPIFSQYVYCIPHNSTLIQL